MAEGSAVSCSQPGNQFSAAADVSIEPAEGVGGTEPDGTAEFTDIGEADTARAAVPTTAPVVGERRAGDACRDARAWNGDALSGAPTVTATGAEEADGEEVEGADEGGGGTASGALGAFSSCASARRATTLEPSMTTAVLASTEDA